MQKINVLKDKRLFAIGVLISIFLAFIDILTKRIVFKIIENSEYGYIKITSFFNIVKVWNHGVSFGMFSDFKHSQIFFSSLVSLIVIFLLIWLYKNKDLYLTIAISLIIGGALGNLCDRIKYGAVADFLDFHIKNIHWPAFNLADSFVFVGVMMLLFEDLFLKKKEAK